MKEPHNYKFGEFRLDADEEILWRNDKKVKINRRTFNPQKA